MEVEKEKPEALWQIQKRYKLTREMVEKAQPNSIIFGGECFIEHSWFNDAKKITEGGNLEEDGRSVRVKFVVYRGGIADWCIYHSLDANLTDSDNLESPDHLEASFDLVARVGSKLHQEEQIKSIVDCDEETFEKYRH